MYMVPFPLENYNSINPFDMGSKKSNYTNHTCNHKYIN